MSSKREWIEAGPGIFYTAERVVAADEGTVAFLKSAAMGTPLERARLCTHPTPQAIQHDMLIVSLRGSYVAPHRHLRKSETMVVIEGQAQAILFEEDGRLADVLPMGPAGSGRIFFYRMPQGIYHGLLIESDALAFVESTLGPFAPEETQSAPWAPAPHDVEGGRLFQRMLEAQIAARSGTR